MDAITSLFRIVTPAVSVVLEAPDTLGLHVAVAALERLALFAQVQPAFHAAADLVAPSHPPTHPPHVPNEQPQECDRGGGQDVHGCGARQIQMEVYLRSGLRMPRGGVRGHNVAPAAAPV